MLSNKLTFSLSFIVMLVFGLAFMATPVMAVPYIDASFSTNTWTVNIEYPVGDGDGEDEVGIGAGVIAPDSPKLTDDGSSGITEITLTDMTVCWHVVAINAPLSLQV